MNDQQQQISVNKVIGQNVLAWRDLSGMSQAEVAARMVEQGFSWQQQTVLKVEKGLRPLKLEEAAGLAKIFVLASVEELLSAGPASRLRSDLVYTIQRLNGIRADMRAHEDALHDLREERARLEVEKEELSARLSSAKEKD